MASVTVQLNLELKFSGEKQIIDQLSDSIKAVQKISEANKLEAAKMILDFAVNLKRKQRP